ncbi:hypothetical protein D3C87_526520 [compost metagenome]
MMATDATLAASKKADMSFELRSLAENGPTRATSINDGMKIPNVEAHAPFQPLI